ncbi:MAG: type II toxin-antitoxin system HicB family antitoxin [Ruminococcaceae bacterium]|nr:type II toxin-antitoxin system HicB family antitoxin [Oscillospiraceae bacterium]
MSNILEYNGYYGSSEVSVEDGVIFGKILHINDLVTFEADNLQDLNVAFQEAVDDYLEFCKANGKNPDKPFKGSFNVRISPENHKRIAIDAAKQNMTLNQFVEQAIIAALDLNALSQEHAIISKSLNTLADSIQSLNNNFISDYMFKGFQVSLENK